MPRSVIPIKTTDRTPGQAAISFTAANATDNHSFDNSSERVVLLIRNLHSSSHNVTIKRPATVDGTALGDVTVAVAANTTSVFGPFPASIYNQNDTGNSLSNMVLVDAPATPTALWFAVIRIGS